MVKTPWGVSDPGLFINRLKLWTLTERLLLLGKNCLMRSAQSAHLFTDAENEKDVHLHDTACNYLLCRKIWAGYGARRRGVKRLLVILIVEIFW